MKQLERFTQAERMLHWSNALSVFFLVITGIIIWQGEDEWELFGIDVISQSHSLLGGSLFIFGALAFLIFRRRHVAFAAKRFKPGQKRGLRFVQVLSVLMGLTGVILFLRQFIPMDKGFRAVVRNMHSNGMWVMAAVVAAHIGLVLLVPSNRKLLRGMVTGYVDPEVAAKAVPEWAAAQGSAAEGREATQVS